MINAVSQTHNFALPFNSQFVEIKTDKGYIGGVVPDSYTKEDIFEKFLKGKGTVEKMLSEQKKVKDKLVKGFLAVKKPISEQNEAEGAKIGTMRILFQRLTKEQIKEINETKELPQNMKIKDDPMGRPVIRWNLMDVTPGTHTLPAGYELKNDILGFTHVVREGTKSIFMK